MFSVRRVAPVLLLAVTVPISAQDRPASTSTTYTTKKAPAATATAPATKAAPAVETPAAPSKARTKPAATRVSVSLWTPYGTRFCI